MLGKPKAPPRSQELIFLDPDDDLGTVRAKLESSPAEEVFLVVPRRAATLRTPLEYRILARMAHELSTDVTIVSGEAGRRHLARQEGLRTRRGYSGVRHLAEAAGAPRSWRLGVPEWIPLPSMTAVLVLALLGAMVGGFALVALPVMRIAITPASETIQRDIELWVDPAARTVDPSRSLLPGDRMQYKFEVTGSVPTAGQKNVGRDPARGEVFFSNGTANPVVLPARSAIVARNGVRFLTDTEVRVDPFTYGRSRVGVTAEQRGVAGNIEANQLASVDPPIQQFTVTNPRAMSGGSDRQARAVTAGDIEKLKQQLMARSREQAMAEFQARGGAAKSVPPNTLSLKIDSETYQPPLDGEGDQVSGTMTVSASVTAWENEALNTLVQRMLRAKYPPEYELPLANLRLTPPEVVETQNTERMRLAVRADAMVIHTLDAEAIAGDLRAKSAAEARAYLQGVPGVAGTPRIEISPSWAPRAYRVEVAVAAPK